MKGELAGKELQEEKKIAKLLSLVEKEIGAPLSYHVVDKICDRLNLPIPPLAKVIDELRAAGFQASPTHFDSRGIRTDASAQAVKEVVRNLVCAP
jgi:tRNA (guanine26-N2/guanine27-N2)-dimethyltransferase